ncbi:Hypothetical protein, putative [Bodo saltans]|uniref:Uncharacterized protein n=1 Tax=Bodo saltans TaxID=75058 RepID=A0A0S4JEL5_BODSA|nr:Hypothetical protein, putative [Bodo saltans]|eukprot:CUG87424.1 Hypothetical protein, putative [Bodo saltans]
MRLTCRARLPNIMMMLNCACHTNSVQKMSSRSDDASLWVGVSSKPRPAGRAPAPSTAVKQQSGDAHRSSTSLELKRVDGQQLCARLLAYVMSRELGGVQNAVTEADELELHTEEHDTATALQLEVELARPTQAALTSSCTYVVRYDDQRGKERCGVTLTSISASFKPVVEDVRTFRRQLHTCWSAIDTSGGITDGLPPAMRASSMRMVEHGLRGEQPQKKRARDDAAEEASAGCTDSTSLSAPHSTTTPSTHLLSLLQDSDDDDNDADIVPTP